MYLQSRKTRGSRHSCNKRRISRDHGYFKILYSDLFEQSDVTKNSRCPRKLWNKPVWDMLSSLRSFERQRAMSFEKNILSDPTSDGNVSTNGQVSERPSSSVYSYEAFESTAPVNFVSDQGNFTQTCPTCGGSGKLTKG